MQCDVLESIDKPFYRGKVIVIVNDSVFQSSNPMRHATPYLNEFRNYRTNQRLFSNSVMVEQIIEPT